MKEAMVPDDLEVIRWVEERIGKQLKKISLGGIIGLSNGVTLNSTGQVVGLNLYNCKLTDISILQSLTRLKTLVLHGNNLTDISALQSLTQLKVLMLSDNQLDDISALRLLTQLEVIWLSNNQLTDISALQSLTQLKVIWLSNNQLTDISALQSLTQLKTLDLGGNKITSLPTFITDWNMEIKWKFLFYTGLKLGGNPLESPPVEIVKRGMNAVRNYFAEMKEEGGVLLMQVKTLFVGEGEVGKTTLMRTLTERRFRLKKKHIGKESTTHGINIKPWSLVCNLEGDTEPARQVTLHSWDFGGQDIYLSTHQFFLTKRSLYIFVWEARKEEESRSFDYWLNVIRLLSGGSPVIVVMNKADVREKSIDEAAYMKKFKNIAAFHRVSCLTREGIEGLTKTILKALGGMPHLKDKLPKTWLDIRDKLRDEKKDHISAARYYEICRSFGMDRDRADHLSDYLHDLGVILRFRTDPLLGKTLVIKPEWATEAVYKLIDTPQIIKNKGRFDFGDLEDIWDPGKYPEDKHPQLIRLMEKFELCFKLTGTTDDTTYIVPELVPGERPDLGAAYFEAQDTLRLQYNYAFMPKGIVSRFIARNYHLIKDERFWQNGVELVFEESSALVIGDPPGRKLEVLVRGPGKRELLAIIRNELNHIHGTLNMEKGKKHYKEEVPCNCAPCREAKEPHLFPFDKLKMLAEKGKTPVCMESGLDVSPEALLLGYEPPKAEAALWEDLKVCASKLQGKGLSLQADENSRTGFVAQLLEARGYRVQEQILWGQSPGGENLGELDLKIDDPEGKPLGICEAFNLTYLNRNVISSHLKKIFKYDPSGLRRNYILVYVESGSFEALWKKYLEHLEAVEYPCPLLGKAKPKEIKEFAEFKGARTMHLRQGKETCLEHLFINMPVRKRVRR